MSDTARQDEQLRGGTETESERENGMPEQKAKAARVRSLLGKACSNVGAEKLAWKVASILPEEVMAELERLIAKEVGEAERKRCAKLMRVSSAELLLMCGEMTAQEMRTVKAVLRQREAAIVEGKT